MRKMYKHETIKVSGKGGLSGNKADFDRWKSYRVYYMHGFTVEWVRIGLTLCFHHLPCTCICYCLHYYYSRPGDTHALVVNSRMILGVLSVILGALNSPLQEHLLLVLNISHISM